MTFVCNLIYDELLTHTQNIPTGFWRDSKRASTLLTVKRESADESADSFRDGAEVLWTDWRAGIATARDGGWLASSQLCHRHARASDQSQRWITSCGVWSKLWSSSKFSTRAGVSLKITSIRRQSNAQWPLGGSLRISFAMLINSSETDFGCWTRIRTTGTTKMQSTSELDWDAFNGTTDC
jgi:hypothetical protein